MTQQKQVYNQYFRTPHTYTEVNEYFGGRQTQSDGVLTRNSLDMHKNDI